MPLFKADTLEVDTDTGGTALLKIDVPGETYNVLNRQLLSDLDAALDRIAEQTSLRLLVLRGMKKSGFLAGADVKQFADITSGEQASALSARGQQLFDKLELLPLPTLAVIHGPCLGGGLELALACDYRLVVDGPASQIGFPEVELGLVPAWGGTQRLPRVVGLERSLLMILSARRLTAREALRWGLADAAARTEAELRAQLDAMMAKAQAGGKRPKRRLPLRTWRQRMVEALGLGRGLVFSSARRQLKRRAPDDLPAPWEALECVRVGVKEGMPAGLAREREAAARLATSPACRNLVTLFLRREQARKLPASA